MDADDTLLPGLWQALEESGALHKDADMILFGMTRQSGPAPCPLAPGLYPTLPALGDALDPLLFESGYLAAPYPKLYRKTGLRFDESLKINEDILFYMNARGLNRATALLFIIESYLTLDKEVFELFENGLIIEEECKKKVNDLCLM